MTDTLDDLVDDEAQAEADELVIEAATFTAPERRELQNRFDTAYGDLLAYTFASIRPGRARVEPILDTRDGARYWPDEIMQHMVWIQARRTDPAATLEDFDHLTLRDLADARARGIQGKANGPERSTSSSPDSSSADSSGPH